MQRVDLSALSTARGGSSRLHGYLARPDGSGPWPGVVVLHESFGVDEVMERMCWRLARAGYLTLLPNLFSDGGALRCLLATTRAALSGRGRAYADIESARQWLIRHDDCTGKVGAVGFCMGGAFAIVVAARGFDAVSTNYGVPPKDLDAALSGACPVVGSYGGRDPVLRGAAAKVDAALERVGVPRDVKEYPRAGHSFLNDAPVGPLVLRPLMKVMGIGPHPESAADAWQRIEAFLGGHLGDDAQS
ncbi:dienelactone hydrolase family protein [Wenjunlia tyrosinilytica]|jgi:carboxymethylenebutenolidase|uniref:Carboxymethylenebutenolidase n=1 Tax=Wenjunlia tyrosinilytica TaxID=1544741 RepID=A0A917ZXI8_9ACTN|nr:dienelactone hydrolase family protein [Wenjunlia tyrosinilytica]GGO95685.1 carboxymethylenebutenolidase [Wenjunlia tyrosinilytica]